jgi:hypothetical protein
MCEGPDKIQPIYKIKGCKKFCIEQKNLLIALNITFREDNTIHFSKQITKNSLLDGF